MQVTNGGLDGYEAAHLELSTTICMSGVRYHLVFATYYDEGMKHYRGQGYLFQPNDGSETDEGRHRWFKYDNMVNRGTAYFNLVDEFDHEWHKGTVSIATYVRHDENVGHRRRMPTEEKDYVQPIRYGNGISSGYSKEDKRGLNISWANQVVL
jgi:hypothetical protein